MPRCSSALVSEVGNDTSSECYPSAVPSVGVQPYTGRQKIQRNREREGAKAKMLHVDNFAVKKIQSEFLPNQENQQTKKLC